jgi:radical SAM superfamily enzyme YgiQ (UPF0313 family)
VRILLVNPPLADPSGPYPAIGYLAGFLKTVGHHADLTDASLALLLRLFTPAGIRQIGDAARADRAHADDAILRGFLAREDQFAETVTTAISVLQGRDHGAYARAARRGYFPPPLDPTASWAFSSYFNVRAYETALGPLSESQRARALRADRPMSHAFGRAGGTDEVRFLASNVIGDICRVIRRAIDPEFELDAYASKLSDDPPTFEAIADRLTRTNLIDALIDQIATELCATHDPDVLGLSVPFAGNLYGAVRIAATVKRLRPDTKIIMGGGWVNTQLRALTDPAIFDVVDFITLDDGERPMACVLEHIAGERPAAALKRTYVREHGRVALRDGAPEADVPFTETGTPTYRGLPLDAYLVVRPSVQSFQRIAGVRWNKLTLAHGCYWKKCAFCDTSLDYIGRYDPASIDVTLDRIRQLRDETGESGFHFVDEAMPPAMMQRLAKRMIDERLNIAWWGNVRFDRALIDMAPLLAASGCIGITGGLEVASDRVLALMDKGVSLEQAARVCQALAREDIYTHAYLIYGFPTQTAQETIDALEYVRQMFKAGHLRSAYWHEFSLTTYSPISRHPARFGLTMRANAPHPFSNYFVEFDEPGRIDHARFGAGLARSLQHYQLGLALDDPLSQWFDFPVPAVSLPPDFVETITRGAGMERVAR